MHPSAQEAGQHCLEGHTGSSLAELFQPEAASELPCDTGDVLGHSRTWVPLRDIINRMLLPSSNLKPPHVFCCVTDMQNI